MLVVGWISFRRLPVDLYPNVEFPIITVTIGYPGAGPSEVENLIARPMEEELSAIAGLKRITSRSLENMAQVTAEFHLGTAIVEAEQQVRDKVGAVRPRMPAEILEPVIRRLDPSAQPIISVALLGDLREDELYDIADQQVKPMLEQVAGVALVEIVGGRKREIHVGLDRAKLAQRELSVQAVAMRVAASGENVPSGTVEREERATVFRTLGEFKSLKDIQNIVVDLFANATPTRLGDLDDISIGLEDEKSRVFVNGRKALFLNIFKQSGSNTLWVADGVREQAALVSKTFAGPGSPSLQIVRDSSQFIRSDVRDVEETILIGIILTVIVVYLFLGNWRSTVITGLALPNSLIGAFILMAIAGFSVNIVSLLALTLAVGLLIDDAIVVRENIYRHIEAGEPPEKAARVGTREVSLAVVATTLVVISVFAPVGFMGGIVGQFMRQFGLTVCFAMAISLFDALTIAPMLSAYFVAEREHMRRGRLWERTLGRTLRAFDRFQSWMEEKYEAVIRFTLKWPRVVLLSSFAIFLISTLTILFIPKIFIPEPDSGEFSVQIELPPGATLDSTAEIAARTDAIIRAHQDVEISAATVGGRFGESNLASIYVHLVPFDDRDVSTSEFKLALREELNKKVPEGAPKVVQFDPIGAGENQPIRLNLIGENLEELQKYADRLVAILDKDERLIDVDTSARLGKPEFQIVPDTNMMQVLGVNTRTLGQELRAQVEGLTPAKFREGGREYDVRLRLKEGQRDLKENFERVLVPNVNNKLIRLETVAKGIQTRGPQAIDRQDRGRYIQITAGLAPNASLSGVIGDIQGVLKNEVKIPPTVRHSFVGTAENFQEMGREIIRAMIFAMLFIYLVLASLYESFITPFTIMLALPLALCGAFLALFLAREPLSLFAILGIVMLLGVASKNSILLVDYARQLMFEEGYDRVSALIKAGRTRLRPILMTSMALIAGTIPVALGLNEAARQRTSMGYAIIGGMVSSTLLSLIVIPAAFIYIDRFGVWSAELVRRLTGTRSRSAGTALRAIDE